MRDVISLQSVTLTIPEHVLFQDVEEEAVLLDLESGEYYGLNPVGARFWRLLQEQGGQLDNVLETMLKEFEVSHEQLYRDMGNFLRELGQHGLVIFHEQNP